MRALWDTSAVRIEPAETEPTHLDRLTRIVTQHLSQIDAPPELADRPWSRGCSTSTSATPTPIPAIAGRGSRGRASGAA